MYKNAKKIYIFKVIIILKILQIKFHKINQINSFVKLKILNLYKNNNNKYYCYKKLIYFFQF